MASPELGDALGRRPISAILLDAGGVMLFPEPANLLPSLRAAGVDPGLDVLELAHYRAMVGQDLAPQAPAPGTWWRDYLLPYVTACGVAADRCEPLAAEIARDARRGWAHAGLGVKEGLRRLAALGLPMGVVSNSDGSVEDDLRRTGVCYVPGAAGQGDGPPEGIPVGVIIDSTVVGVAKPDPRIFSFALDALGVPADGTVLHVGDSLRYDVAGALAAGLQPVHLDPHGFCPQPDGHPHVRSLTDLAESLATSPR